MSATARATRFCQTFDLRLPVLMAPMAGSSPPALAAAVAEAGGMGACGALSLSPQGIADWVARMRQMSPGAFLINLWIADAPVPRDAAAEAAQAAFLARFGPTPSLPQGPLLPDFDAQFAAILHARPKAASSIMGLFRPDQVAALKTAGILWIATATSLAEGRAAQAAGADAVIAQGAEAGGHRGGFTPADAARDAIGTFALVPALADALRIPVIAAGGIGDSRTLAAALTLGASAGMIGTALLRTPEAAIAPVWAQALAEASVDDTLVTPAFSGRPARTLRNAYTEATRAPEAPPPLPYPVQRALTEPMRQQALKDGSIAHLYALAGQGVALARPEPAQALVEEIWVTARALLR